MRAVLFFLDHPDIGGVYNVGTGTARSWLDVARAMFSAVNTAEKIVFIDMPEHIKHQYQYFTQADMKKLVGVGFDTAENYVLEDAICEYVQGYLAPHRHIGEAVL